MSKKEKKNSTLIKYWLMSLVQEMEPLEKFLKNGYLTFLRN
jgi:hypothetical protein